MKIDTSILTDIVQKRMPFGRFKDYLLCDLPIEYLLWFKQKGLPKGRLGVLMENVLELKYNDLYHIIAGLKKRYGR